MYTAGDHSSANNLFDVTSDLSANASDYSEDAEENFLTTHGSLLDPSPSPFSSSKDLVLNSAEDRGKSHDDMNMYYEQGVVDARAKAHDGVFQGNVTGYQVQMRLLPQWLLS